MTPDFLRQMNRLRGLRFVPADLQTHWEALNTLPLDVLEQAVSLAQRTRTDFPTPVELRTDADTAFASQRVTPAEDDGTRQTPLEAPVAVEVPHTALTLTVKSTWRYDCEDCSDGGMVSVWCGASAPAKPWYFRGDCGRRQAHPDHEFVRPCPCAATNPTIQRRQAARAQYAAEAPKQRRAS